MPDLLGIDLGTSLIKVGRFDEAGRLVTIASRAYREPNEDSLPLERIWEALVETTREVTVSTRDRGDVASIGIASQVNSFALIGRRGEPITNVFLWTGNWAEGSATRINREGNPASTIHAVGMQRLTGQLMLPKCAHLREQQPTVWHLSRGIRQLADLVTCRLTGEHVTSPSLWSLTGFYDLTGQTWWSSALERLHIQAEMLPRLAPTGSLAGMLKEDIASELDLPPETPVGVGTVDHLAGAISLGNVAPRQASISIGTTSCVVVTHERRPPAMSGGVIGRHPADIQLWYALAWSGLSTSGLRWCLPRDEDPPPLSELLELASQLPENDAGWIAQPHDPNDAHAGFAFVPPAGAPPDFDSVPDVAQKLRAVVNCVNVQIERLLDQARAMQTIDSVAVTGGGACSDAWMQLLANRLRLPVERPQSIEACVRGAALCGGRAAGNIASLTDAPRDACCVFSPASQSVA